MLHKFFTSGWICDESNLDLKHRYEMLNMGLVVATFVLIYVVLANISQNTESRLFEIFLILANISYIFILRLKRKYFHYIAILMTAQFTLFFLFLFYTSEPNQLKHIWLFTYPVILLHFRANRESIYWFSFLVLMILVAPLQNFVAVKYSLHQAAYITFALASLNALIHFYQQKMNEAKELVLAQQMKLQEKIYELEKKDKLLNAQSKQAVMGEMISMIAHQWRQPLSTITLQISNYQFQQLLNSNSKERQIDKTLAEISDTIIYLSETIDDFQTYFRPNKELSKIDLDSLLQRVSNFILPRVKESNVELEIVHVEEIELHIYINEFIQVLLNLINNAIDSLVENRIKNAKVTLSSHLHDGMLEISVKDNSVGISEENLPRLFEPYFSTKGKNGTGLGLYMSNMIIQKQFNGTIEVETSGEGSTFKVSIVLKDS